MSGSLIVCMSVYLSVRPSVLVSVCLSVRLSDCPSACLFVLLSACLSVYLSVLSVCPVCLSCLSVRLSICLSFVLPTVTVFSFYFICQSIHLYMLGGPKSEGFGVISPHFFPNYKGLPINLFNPSTSYGISPKQNITTGC